VITSPDRQLLERVRAEYLDMPGLQLWPAQVQRLCGAERAACQVVLDTLVESKFLRLKSNASYARLMDY